MQLRITLWRICVSLALFFSLVLPNTSTADKRETVDDVRLHGNRYQPALDTFSDTWVATDALGRRILTRDSVGPPRDNRWVGIFYFLWHDSPAIRGPLDVSRILEIDPKAAAKRDSPLWGTSMHRWGQPLFGYYTSDDAWVLRKHAHMLADAGVDTLIFDVSNNSIFEKNYTTLFEVFAEARAQGNATPYVAFMAPFTNRVGKTVQKLYDRIYKPGLHEDLWFMWEDKPLILANPENVSPDLLDFFTFRTLQPGFFHGPVELPKYGSQEFKNMFVHPPKPQDPERKIVPNMWGWEQVYPQHVFPNDRGEKEQITVSAAQPAVIYKDGMRMGTFTEEKSLGRGYHGGRHSNDPDDALYGRNFQEQWNHALKEDPLFTLVTGWNQWMAVSLQGDIWGTGVDLPIGLIHEYNQERSDDVEPMKGGHGDNFYYQMASNIRKYKGARSVPVASKPKSIDINGPFDQWDNVGPEYRDHTGDTMHRRHPGVNTVTEYVDQTGRNDFVLMKVAHDQNFVYFYAQTREAITPYTDPSWMVLFINTDNDSKTGWQGYDYVINRRVLEEGRSMVELTSNGWNWHPMGEASFRAEGNQLMVAVPQETLGVAAESALRFEFKWSDNYNVDDYIYAFTTHGDSAPPGRFNYFYRTE